MNGHFLMVNYAHCYSLDWTRGRCKVHLPNSITVYVCVLIADIFWDHKNPFAYNKTVFFLKLLSSRQPDQECVPSTGTLLLKAVATSQWQQRLDAWHFSCALFDILAFGHPIPYNVVVASELSPKVAPDCSGLGQQSKLTPCCM